MPAPVIERTEDSTADGVRTLRLRIASRRNAPAVFVYGDPRDGIALELQVRARPSPLQMEIIDETYGLDGLPGAPLRPADTMPLAWRPNSIFVRKTYSF
jgi:hypothetical protein